MLYNFTNLTEQEANAILTALGAQPYNAVAALINKLVAQAQQQTHKQHLETIGAQNNGDENQKAD